MSKKTGILWHNLSHEKFCRMYVSGPVAFMGKRVLLNATRAYMAVYPKASYKTALVNGPRLKKRLLWRINELIDFEVATYLNNRISKWKS